MFGFLANAMKTLPIVMGVIHVVEKLIPNGTGSDKNNLYVEGLVVALKSMGYDRADDPQFKPIVSQLATDIINLEKFLTSSSTLSVTDGSTTTVTSTLNK